MAYERVTTVNPAEIILENIFIALQANRMTFGKDISARIVGGEKKLERLVAEGKINAVKGTTAQNSKWRCNAVDVLRHVRNMRK